MRGPGQNVARAAFRLAATYPETDLGNPPDALDDLIYIILSGQTNEKNYQATFQRLRKAFPAWRGLSKAKVERIEKLIRGGGLARQKAQYIRNILARIEADFGTASLNTLSTWSTEKAEDYLKALPGVGIKSARCVLMYSLNRDVFPADVNCLRVMERMGWLKWNGKRAELLADAAQDLVPAPLRRSLHINLVEHGRKICTGSRPRCSECCIAEFCAHAKAKKKARPMVVDLCCGAGGFSWGFMQAGFEVLLGADNCEHALATYEANIIGATPLTADITAASALSEIKEKLGDRRPAVVIAGPPCQGFSRAGPRKASDPRNAVLRTSMKLAIALKPDVIVFENVMNVRAEAFVHHFDKTMGVARRAGYRFAHAVLRANAFGVPQSRKRVVLVASRINDRETLQAVLRDLEDRPLVENITVADALQGVPIDPASAHSLSNHEPMRHSKRVIAKIKKIKPGTGPLSYRKLDPQQLAPTLICGHRALPCHYETPRTITTREAARVQGFPDVFRFEGARGNQMLQVANAVPPRLALGVATGVLSLLGISLSHELKTLIDELLSRVAFSPSQPVAAGG